MAEDRKDGYFRLPDFFWMALVLFGLYLMVCCLYAPAWVPFDYLGPIGALSRYLANDQPWLVNSFIVFALVTHTIYVPYSAYLCRNKGLSSSAEMKWMLSSFIFGGFSVYHLRRYEPKQE